MGVNMPLLVALSRLSIPTAFPKKLSQWKFEKMYPVAVFVVLKLCYPTRTEFMDVMAFIDTRKFYKVFYVVSGSSAIMLNDRLFLLNAGDIIFQRPGDRLSFQTSDKYTAYLCLVHTEYLSTVSIYLLDLFSHFPLHLFHRAVIPLDNRQSEIVRLSFESIIAELESRNPDKEQATALHLQMILLQIQRAGLKNSCSKPFCYS